MKRYSQITLLLFTLTGFIGIIFAFKEHAPVKNGMETTEDAAVTDTYAYYSDYFVFIADDDGTPLVIPTDFNWSPSKNGYNSEFKAWYGTKNTWPIAYFKEHTDEERSGIPKESWEHADSKSFQFNADSREITSNINGAPNLKFKIPEKQEWTIMPTTSKLKELYGFRTTATVKGASRSGWMIYERIRWKAEDVQDFGDFGAFYWIPLVVDGDFFLFEQHKGEQIAVKWSLNMAKKVIVETIPDFTLNVLDTSKDAPSNRKNIPKTMQVLAPHWDLDITLKSGGSQIGYGDKFPNGLAYYRQSILQSDKNSKVAGYGMLELILEND